MATNQTKKMIRKQADIVTSKLSEIRSELMDMYDTHTYYLADNHTSNLNEIIALLYRTEAQIKESPNSDPDLEKFKHWEAFEECFSKDAPRFEFNEEHWESWDDRDHDARMAEIQENKAEEYERRFPEPDYPHPMEEYDEEELDRVQEMHDNIHAEEQEHDYDAMQEEMEQRDHEEEEARRKAYNPEYVDLDYSDDHEQDRRREMRANAPWNQPTEEFP